MRTTDIASDTIDIMDVWAVYFQERESRCQAEIALAEITEGTEQAPDVMADMRWLLLLKEDVQSTLQSGSSEAFLGSGRCCSVCSQAPQWHVLLAAQRMHHAAPHAPHQGLDHLAPHQGLDQLAPHHLGPMPIPWIAL